MDFIRVHLLGTSPLVTPDRYQTATAVETPEGIVLIDAAEPAAASMIRQGLSLDKLREVLITHWHGDHQSGLQSLLLQLRRGPTNVHLPVSRQVLDWIEGARKAYAWPLELPSDQVKLELLRPGNKIRMGRLSIEAVENDHLWHHLNLWKHYQLTREEITAFSFVLRYGNLRIVYSGDLGTQSEEKEFWKLLEEPADLVVLEAGHVLPMEGLLKKIKGKRIGFLAMNHLYLEAFEEKTLRDYFIRNMDCPVLVSRDGDWVELSESGGQTRVKSGHREDLSGRLKAKVFLTPDQRRQVFVEKGIPLQWHIVGPFANQPNAKNEYPGLWADYGAMKDRSFSGKYRDMDGLEIEWRTLGVEDLPDDGRVPFDWIYDRIEALAYAATDVELPADGEYRLLFGSDDGMRLWVDDKEVYCVSAERGQLADTEEIVMPLTKGKHRVTIAVEQRYGSWFFYFRMIPK
jgi:phosphoribosyl 1,2-cyclic phosphodiesterase